MQTVAIVGAGFCGTLIATHLLRTAHPSGIRVLLINRPTVHLDGSSSAALRLARGLAYGTQSAAHLLNVPAGRMSALPAQPDDFIDFLRRHRYPAEGGSFVPRDWYGRYLNETLTNAATAGVALGNLLLTRFAEVTNFCEQPIAISTRLPGRSHRARRCSRTRVGQLCPG